MKFKTSCILILLSIILIVSGCTSKKEEEKKTASTDTPAYGDAIIIGSIGDASSLIPNITSDSASHDIGGMVYRGLVRYDKDLKLEGEMAESWDISQDGLTITFHLRKSIKWHDGHEFTADDVYFTYKTMVDPNTPTAYSGDFLLVKKAEVVDKYTFRVTYDKPFAPALESWGISVLPKHLLEGKDIRKSELNKHPIGTGPYKFKEWKTGDRIVLESSPDYFEGKPYISRYIYKIIPDTATMFLELKAGNVDWMGLTPLQYTRQTETQEFQKNFKKYKYVAFGYTYLGYNLLDPRFKDKRIRQAISHAIDKREIIDGVIFGLGQEATGPYKPGTWAYNTNVKKYPYDPEKAKALLAEAGWKDTNKDGILDKNGVPFQFTIMTNQGNEQRQKSAEIIQRKLAAIGIKVNIRIIEWSAFINEFINKKKYEAIILGWSISLDPDQYDIWHSSKTKPGELNHISFKNSEVDDLLTKARHTFDQEKRREYYFKFQEILAEEQPYTFLYVPDALPVIHARFRGIEPAPAGIAYNFTKWYVPKNLQKHLQ